MDVCCVMFVVYFVLVDCCVLHAVCVVLVVGDCALCVV